MRAWKVEWLYEQLNSIIDCAVTDALKYQGEGNPFENYEEEYDLIKSLLEDYGETGISDFQDSFFRNHEHMKKVLDESNKEYWLNEGNYEMMFEKGSFDETYRFIEKEFNEFIIDETDNYKRKFLAAISKYLTKMIKMNKNLMKEPANE